MASRTVSLEEGAYARLKAAKRPGESFSETVNRILSNEKPTFLALSGFLTKPEALSVRRAIRDMRSHEAIAESAMMNRRRKGSGSVARH